MTRRGLILIRVLWVAATLGPAARRCCSVPCAASPG